MLRSLLLTASLTFSMAVSANAQSLEKAKCEGVIQYPLQWAEANIFLVGGQPTQFAAKISLKTNVSARELFAPYRFRDAISSGGGDVVNVSARYSGERSASDFRTPNWISWRLDEIEFTVPRFSNAERQVETVGVRINAGKFSHELDFDYPPRTFPAMMFAPAERRPTRVLTLRATPGGRSVSDVRVVSADRLSNIAAALRGAEPISLEFRDGARQIVTITTPAPPTATRMDLLRRAFDLARDQFSAGKCRAEFGG